MQPSTSRKYHLATTGASLRTRVHGAAHVLRVSQKTCLAGGGAINRSKLKGYLLVDKGGALGYAASQLSTVRGVIKRDSTDLAMVKIPIVMGEPPRAVLVKYQKALRNLHWVVPRTEPAYPLALQVVTTFALTKAFRPGRGPRGGSQSRGLPAAVGWHPQACSGAAP